MKKEKIHRSFDVTPSVWNQFKITITVLDVKITDVINDLLHSYNTINKYKVNEKILKNNENV